MIRPALPLIPAPVLLAAGVAWLALTLPAPAVDPPHDRGKSCATCHLDHAVFGSQWDYLEGNDNLCISCHSPGGSASARALGNGDQAAISFAPAGTASGRGTSHRWDSYPAGRVTGVGTTPAAGLMVSGTYTGKYVKSFTVTITAGGGASSSRFEWSAQAPFGGGGTNLATGSSVPLTEGITLTFLNVRPPPAFQAGDRWEVQVRPNLTAPDNAGLLWCMPGGQVICSTCHDQHSQANEPFDPGAPPYAFTGTGQGRHFLRMDNDTDQMCAECHAGKFVTNAVAGSHPVGVLVASNAWYHPPGSLPLDKNQGRMWCSTCHQVHHSASQDGNLLRAEKTSALCAECHALAANRDARHLQPLDGTLWPGGKYGSLMPPVTNLAQRGACGNCHQVHGWPDTSQPSKSYLSLLVESEEKLCYTCHDGSPVTKNLRANFAKAYSHPVALAGRHQPGEGADPARYGTANRHAECVDCHNPHALGTDATTPRPPAASRNLAGVSRVSVTNVSSGQVLYAYRGPEDPTPVKEYEVCFTCHSSWTTQPAGQGNFAAEFNDKNPSFHPVEALGKNLNINLNAFVNDWRADRSMACTDCHTSDDPTIRGPHGSTNQFILKKRTVASATRRTTATVMASDEICFDCHRFDTYANNSASSTIRNYSRFSGGHGHTYHVGSQRYSCFNCHDSHGSSTLPNLLVTGRSPGITTYTRTASGGSCVATCHGGESYTVTYPR